MKNGIIKAVGIVCSICLSCLFISCGEKTKVIEGKIQNNGSEEIEVKQEKIESVEMRQEYQKENVKADEKHKGYYFFYQGTEIEINAVADLVLRQLGEANSYFEAPSCAFDGIDRIYTYNSFELDTYPIGEVDYVSSILFKDDSITTVEGIGIGDSEEKLIEIYGGDYFNQDGIIAYRKDDMKLCFIVEDGNIVSIEYKTTVLDE